jgi:hypothetical protein
MANLGRAWIVGASFLLTSFGGAQSVGSVALQPLAFLSGRWVSEKPDEVQEESWSPVMGDSVTGSFRVVAGGKPVFYEFWAVELEANQPVMKMKHFNAGFVGWEAKDVSVRMPLVSSAKDDAIFAETDGSVSLHYHRSGETLRCTVHHVKDGKPSDEVFVLTRAPRA